MKKNKAEKDSGELVRVKYVVRYGGLAEGTIVSLDKSKASDLIERGIAKVIEPASKPTNKSFADKQDLIKKA